MLFQSVHSFHHIVEEFSATECHHDYGDSKTEITHQHSTEKCFTCEYRFGSFVCSEHFIALKHIVRETPTFTIHSPESVVIRFKSTTSLRGPPNCYA